jgi:hypothetical protein
MTEKPETEQTSVINTPEAIDEVKSSIETPTLNPELKSTE